MLGDLVLELGGCGWLHGGASARLVTGWHLSGSCLLHLDGLKFIQRLKKKEAIIKSNDFLLEVSSE
jgi:hypothetical protein